MGVVLAGASCGASDEASSGFCSSAGASSGFCSSAGASSGFCSSSGASSGFCSVGAVVLFRSAFSSPVVVPSTLSVSDSVVALALAAVVASDDNVSVVLSPVGVVASEPLAEVASVEVASVLEASVVASEL